MEKTKGRNAALCYLAERIRKRRALYDSKYKALADLYGEFQALLESADDDLHQDLPASLPDTWARIRQRALHNQTHLQDTSLQIYILGDTQQACDVILRGLLGDCQLPDQVWRGLQETVTFKHSPKESAKLWLREGNIREVSLAELPSYTKGEICSVDINLPIHFLQDNVRLVVRPRLRKATLSSELISRSVLIIVRSFQGGKLTWGTKSLTKRDLALIEHRNDNVIRVLTESAASHSDDGAILADGEEDILPFTFIPIGCDTDSPEWKTLFAKLDSGTSFLLRQKLLDSFRWLQSSMQNLHQALAKILEEKTETREQVLAKRRELTAKLDRKKREADYLLLKFEEQIARAKLQLNKQCIEYLHTDEGKNRLSSWESYEIPRMKLLMSWEKFTDTLHGLCAHKIHSSLAEYVSETGVIQRLMLDMQRTLLEELTDIDHQYSGLGDWLGSPSVKSPMSPKRIFLMNKAESFPVEGIGDIPLPLEQLADLLDDMTLTTLMPMLQTLLWGPDQPLRVEFSKLSMSSIYSSLSGRAEYIANPKKYMKRLSLSTLDQIGDNEVYDFINHQFQPAASILSCGRDVIQTVLSHQRMGLEKGDGLNLILEKSKSVNESEVKMFQAKITAYAENCLNEEDQEFSVLDVVVDLLSHGCFAEYRAVKVKVNEESAPTGALLKTYKYWGATRCWLDEMNICRCSHPYIASFLGSTKLEKTGPRSKCVLVFRGHLVPAKKEYFGGRNLPPQSDGRNVLLRSFRCLLEQVALGLEYLHARGLVHVDLSLDTIMVSVPNHTVKLVNVSEPRVVSHVLTPDEETRDCVYLAPEVLHGKHYRAASDVYSLGLVAWELWEQKLAFQTQRSEKLRDFRKHQHAALLGSSSEGPFSSLVVSSLHETPSARMPISDWVDGIRQVELPPDVQEGPDFQEITI